MQLFLGSTVALPHLNIVGVTLKLILNIVPTPAVLDLCCIILKYDAGSRANPDRGRTFNGFLLEGFEL